MHSWPLLLNGMTSTCFRTEYQEICHQSQTYTSRYTFCAISLLEFTVQLRSCSITVAYSRTPWWRPWKQFPKLNQENGTEETQSSENWPFQVAVQQMLHFNHVHHFWKWPWPSWIQVVQGHLFHAGRRNGRVVAAAAAAAAVEHRCVATGRSDAGVAALLWTAGPYTVDEKIKKWIKLDAHSIDQEKKSKKKTNLTAN